MEYESEINNNNNKTNIKKGKKKSKYYFNIFIYNLIYFWVLLKNYDNIIKFEKKKMYIF